MLALFLSKAERQRREEAAAVAKAKALLVGAAAMDVAAVDHQAAEKKVGVVGVERCLFPNAWPFFNSASLFVLAFLCWVCMCQAAEERAAAAAAANGGVPHNETTAGITGPVGDYSKKRISCACVRPWLDKARRSVPVPVRPCCLHPPLRDCTRANTAPLSMLAQFGLCWSQILFSIHMALRLLATPMLLGANRLWAAAGVWFGLVVISGVFRPMRWVEDSFVVIGGDIECIIYVFFRLVEPCTATHHAVEVTTIGAVVCGTTARLVSDRESFVVGALRRNHCRCILCDVVVTRLLLCAFQKFADCGSVAFLLCCRPRLSHRERRQGRCCEEIAGSTYSSKLTVVAIVLVGCDPYSSPNAFHIPAGFKARTPTST